MMRRYRRPGPETPTEPREARGVMKIRLAARAVRRLRLPHLPRRRPLRHSSARTGIRARTLLARAVLHEVQYAVRFLQRGTARWGLPRESHRAIRHRAPAPAGIHARASCPMVR